MSDLDAISDREQEELDDIKADVITMAKDTDLVDELRTRGWVVAKGELIKTLVDRQEHYHNLHEDTGSTFYRGVAEGIELSTNIIQKEG